MIPQEDGKRFLKVARGAVDSAFSGKEPNVESELAKKYSAEQGVFVTLTIDGELRGCIGFPEPVMPLTKAIVEAARSAAFSDPRFPQLTKDDFRKVKFEVSVLTVPELIRVKKPDEYLKIVRIGKDGLIIRGSYGSGLLLPQVFAEYNCTPLQALEMTCQKAGLSRDSWKNLDNKIYRFQAEIFSEK
ncbi:AmmeMemoRadiSam system protein A [Candidatus Woesearchaeota archaeon]|nr:AmmeMemoRadiSam system protein A [Candidatus Woesearchaeota archaeon]